MIATDTHSGRAKGAPRAVPADHIQNGFFGQDILEDRSVIYVIEPVNGKGGT